MRLGLIGYGLRGRHHAEAVLKAPGAEPEGIACATDKTAAAARERFPDTSFHRDIRALPDDASIEAVDIILPKAAAVPALGLRELRELYGRKPERQVARA